MKDTGQRLVLEQGKFIVMVLTFGMYSLIGAEYVHLEVVVVCRTFGVPKRVVALFLDMAAEQ